MTDAQQDDIYGWPQLLTDPDDDNEVEWASWAYKARDELRPVYVAAFQPLPDEPSLLDQVVTQEIDGWLPRAAALAVKAEFYLAQAKGRLYPSRVIDPDTGKPITAGERDALYEGSLAPYRFVRDEFDTLVRRLAERVRWAQSVRKSHGEAQ